MPYSPPAPYPAQTPRIRPGRTGDLPLLQEIERAAGSLFRALGMDAVADDEPPTEAELRAYLDAGGLRVAAPDGPVVAYVLLASVDGCTHVEQVSVHPAAAHRRIGRALIEHAAEEAAAAGIPALTLTTFTEVPWNAPYYARMGFRLLTDAELTPGLRKLRARETAVGLDRWPRACMRRDLTGDGARVSGTQGASEDTQGSRGAVDVPGNPVP